MNSTLYFSISSLIYTIVIAIIFFRKEKINNTENRIFQKSIVISIVSVVIELLIILAIKLENELLLHIILKSFNVCIFSWIALFGTYAFVVSHKESSVDYRKKYKILYLVYRILWIIVAIVICCLPIYLYQDLYSYGPSCEFLYMCCFALMAMMIIFLLQNLRNLLNKRYYPVILFVILMVIIGIIQKCFPEVLLVNWLFGFIILVMYFTIENPDLKMIEQLNIAKGQAEKANAAKTDFLSNMSHEIRTPLNAIVGFSQSLGDNESLSDEAKEQVKDILAASDNLLEIVNGILDISKIEANKLEIVNKEYSFKKIFNELVILTKSRIGEKPIELRTSMDPTIPPVLYGDYVRLKQIILNLLTNAAKYTKEGYIELKVSSVQKDDICRLIISVEDTGIGIAKEKIDKLFTKFERFDLEENITIEGTGLGLAITKKLVELMNGRIVVQSDYGFGSKFTVAIDQKIMAGVILEDSKTGVIPQVGNIAGKKVLVVDDNALNLKVASMLLKKYSLEVDTVSSGFECIEKWKQGNCYDLILMDDMMPKMSGGETLKQLKQDPAFQTPVVALTANAISGMREKYLSEGFDDYLAKPIDRTELDRVLEHYLKK